METLLRLQQKCEVVDLGNKSQTIKEVHPDAYFSLPTLPIVSSDSYF